jgi:hypothetical protein
MRSKVSIPVQNPTGQGRSVCKSSRLSSRAGGHEAYILVDDKTVWKDVTQMLRECRLATARRTAAISEIDSIGLDRIPECMRAPHE